MSTEILTSEGYSKEEFDDLLRGTINGDTVYHTTVKDLKEMGYTEVTKGYPDSETAIIYDGTIVIDHKIAGILGKKNE